MCRFVESRTFLNILRSGSVSVKKTANEGTIKIHIYVIYMGGRVGPGRPGFGSSTGQMSLNSTEPPASPQRRRLLVVILVLGTLIFYMEKRPS
ncbi:hypothetical protein J6590_025696 [Homalodisca vitripennis]|nr:hypothetical protein J6590_025696 [Homalodisca vitripennis]